MTKTILSLLILILLPLLFCGITCGKKAEETTMPEETKISGKKVVLIVAHDGYQDVEYKDTRSGLEGAGVKVSVASSSLGKASGKLGGMIEVDMLIGDVDAKDFDGIVFIGGPGAQEYIEDAKAHKLASEAKAQDKVLGAICIAPQILAKAGVLSGKKATVWSDVLDKSGIDVLKENGAEYVEEDVVVDGKIVTGNGPGAAKKFGQSIAELLR